MSRSDALALLSVFVGGCLEPNPDWDEFSPSTTSGPSGTGVSSSSESEAGSQSGSTVGDEDATSSEASSTDSTSTDSTSTDSTSSESSSTGTDSGDTTGGNTDPYGECPGGEDSECSDSEICIQGTIDGMDWSLCSAGTCANDDDCDVSVGDTCESLPGDGTAQEFCVSQICDSRPCPTGMHCGTGVNADVCVWPI